MKKSDEYWQGFEDAAEILLYDQSVDTYDELRKAEKEGDHKRVFYMAALFADHALEAGFLDVAERYIKKSCDCLAGLKDEDKSESKE